MRVRTPDRTPDRTPVRLAWLLGWWLGRFRRWRRVLAVLLVAVLGQLALAQHPQVLGEPVIRAAGRLGTLSLQARSDTVVGSPITVDVIGAAPGTSVSLLVSGTLGTATLRTDTEATGLASFRLPHPDTTWAGQVVLQADSDGALGRLTMTLSPGPMLGPVTGVIGPGTIVADTDDKAMDVVLSMDRYGNAPVDGTPLSFVRTWPDGRTTRSAVRSEHLLAWADLRSGTTAGRDLVHAEQDGATGPDNDLGEVAAAPAGWSLKPRRPGQSGQRDLTADGRSLTEVDTSVLHDRHGNVEPDGTAVVLVGTGPGGAWRISATTVAGVAKFFVQASPLPGVVRLTGYCRGSRTAHPLSLVYRADAARLPLTGTREGQYLEVRIGPVVDVRGAQVDDGTQVEVSARDSHGHQVSSAMALLDGRAGIELAIARLKGPVTVTATLLGRRGRTTVR